MNYEAILFVSFGAPEKHSDVMPFLRNVVKGRGVPDERLLEVAENYELFGGKSPLTEQNREIIEKLKASLAENGVDLPVYFGNRNWNPFLSEAMSEMKRDNVKNAVAFVTSAYSSYSGCRQYREDVEKAKLEADFTELETYKLPVFYHKPLFIEANAEHLQNELDKIPSERRKDAQVIFTAHSIPLSMSANCNYLEQLTETCRRVAETVGHENYQLAFQSRSGSPQVPWLEPDVNDALRELENVQDVVIHPIGFLSDHIEVMYDLDTQAKATAHDLNMNFYRVKTVGTNPKFIKVITDSIIAGLRGEKDARFCHETCCLPAVRPAGRP
ncbi:MAG: ferrochelatase [Pyrinomonadaceae bacterium]|nr:ferrochelatase [Pyrinomonadaceae bacterium]